MSEEAKAEESAEEEKTPKRSLRDRVIEDLTAYPMEPEIKKQAIEELKTAPAVRNTNEDDFDETPLKALAVWSKLPSGHDFWASIHKTLYENKND